MKRQIFNKAYSTPHYSALAYIYVHSPPHSIKPPKGILLPSLCT